MTQLILELTPFADVGDVESCCCRGRMTTGLGVTSIRVHSTITVGPRTIKSLFHIPNVLYTGTETDKMSSIQVITPHIKNLFSKVNVFKSKMPGISDILSGIRGSSVRGSSV